MTAAERIEHDMSNTVAGLLLIKEASTNHNPPRRLAYLAGQQTQHAISVLDQVDWKRVYEQGQKILAQW